MEGKQLGTWLRWLRVAAEIVYIVSLCLAVAVLVIAFIPGSPVTLGLPTSLLSGLDGVGGVAPGVVVDPEGTVVFKVTDPSLGQRMLYLATMLPGLAVIAEVARRTAKMLRAAQNSDPFTAQTARELTTVAKLTVIGGLVVWVSSAGANWVLSVSMLSSGAATGPLQSPLGWLAVGLIFGAFAQLVGRGVAMRAELDSVI